MKVTLVTFCVKSFSCGIAHLDTPITRDSTLRHAHNQG